MCTPRIYIADLAAYNAGILHGVWIDATLDMDEILAEIQAMLNATPVDEGAEEYALHDYEGFEGLNLDEYESLSSIYEKAELITAYGQLGAKVYQCLGFIDEAKDALENKYHGCFTSIADYAQDLTEQCGDIPQHLAFYIDYEKMGRDMVLSGDIYTIKLSRHEVHIFSNQ